MIFKRKIMAAILSCLLFSLISFIPDGFNLNGFLVLYFLGFMFVGTYGIIASFISDWVSQKLFKSPNGQEICSFMLHLLFGSVFLTLSLVAASLFFLTDRLLKRINLNWWTVIIALVIVAIVFIVNVM